ncbi:multicopy suppressor of chk1 protein 1-like [Thrips palmi]|uniref:Multicopy suppressor of chk1 protein 1-like n=1 Tax=Thrips palmi TaxID=161013 RepID=A0A6P8ZYW4_THRPL|nr:multicopy suppressor of chk1 protein 1-like [Thrips palmi]
MVYCFCRQPADEHPMVHCDACNEWYHFRCVGLKNNQVTAVRKLANYNCSLCIRFRSLENQLLGQISLLEAKIYEKSNQEHEQTKEQKRQQAYLEARQCSHLTNVNKDLEQKLKEAEAALKSLQGQYNLLTDANKEREQRLIEAEAALKSMEGQRNLLTDANKELEQKLLQAQADLKSLKRQNNILSDENTVLKKPHGTDISSNIKRKKLSLSKVTCTAGSTTASQQENKLLKPETRKKALSQSAAGMHASGPTFKKSQRRYIDDEESNED